VESLIKSLHAASFCVHCKLNKHLTMQDTVMMMMMMMMEHLDLSYITSEGENI